MSDNTFDRIWGERLFHYDPTLPLERQLPCAYARTFQAWVDVLFNKHLETSDRVRLNQLKLVVQDKYFELQTRVPAEHRHDDDRDPDHPCVYSVFARTIAVLHERELELDPPALTLPTPPSSPPKPRKSRRTPLDRLILGEEDPEFGS